MEISLLEGGSCFKCRIGRETSDQTFPLTMVPVYSLRAKTLSPFVFKV